jgi:hypothetical protein
MDTSILSSTVSTTRSVSRSLRPISGKASKNSTARGKQMRMPQAPRCSNSKITLMASILARHLTFGVVYLSYDLLAGFDIVSASFDQRHPP